MTQAEEDRRARLAQSLRDNLRRRKAQARAQPGDGARPDAKPAPEG